MESLLVTGLVVAVVLWYFGNVINSIISRSGKMADREYQAFEREQAFRLAKGKEELKGKVIKFQSENKLELSDEDMNKFLGI